MCTVSGFPENVVRNDRKPWFFFFFLSKKERSVQLRERQFAKSYLFHAPSPPPLPKPPRPANSPQYCALLVRGGCSSSFGPRSKGLPRLFCTSATTQYLLCTSAIPFRTSPRGFLLAACKRPVAPSPFPFSGNFPCPWLPNANKFLLNSFCKELFSKERGRVQRKWVQPENVIFAQSLA